MKEKRYFPLFLYASVVLCIVGLFTQFGVPIFLTAYVTLMLHTIQRENIADEK
jgi:hypothetical protein